MDDWTRLTLYKLREKESPKFELPMPDWFYATPDIHLLTFKQMVDIIKLRAGLYGIPIVKSIYMTPLSILYQAPHKTGLFGEKILVSVDMYEFLKSVESADPDEWQKEYSRWWPSMYGLSRPIISIA